MLALVVTVSCPPKYEADGVAVDTRELPLRVLMQEALLSVLIRDRELVLMREQVWARETELMREHIWFLSELIRELARELARLSSTNLRCSETRSCASQVA